MVSDKDQALLALLQVNAREPVASLARKLGVSRSTVQDRLKRLETSGVIAGYGVRLAAKSNPGGLQAFVTIAVEPRRSTEVAQVLKRYPEIEALHTVSGKYDFAAFVRARDADAMDALLDRIGATPGVKRTESAIVLSTRVDRR